MLPPRRILVHIDDAQSAPRRLMVARDLARPLDADVLACYAATPSAKRHSLQVGLAIRGYDEANQQDMRRRDAAYDAFSATCGDASNVFWVSLPEHPETLFVRQALYADYLVLQQPDLLNDHSGVPAGFVDHVLVRSGKPAIVLPQTGIVRAVPRTVAIAWSETREAAHAVTCAMPLLMQAEAIHIIGFGEESRASVAALSSRLRARRLEAKLHYLEDEGAGIGRLLLDRATEVGADLMVMGCYGHSQTRELILGGVTRTVLDTMTLPLLMAH
jgi:nucleotide-binding universal stress UspA family protein